MSDIYKSVPYYANGSTKTYITTVDRLRIAFHVRIEVISEMRSIIERWLLDNADISEYKIQYHPSMSDRVYVWFDDTPAAAVFLLKFNGKII